MRLRSLTAALAVVLMLAFAASASAAPALTAHRRPAGCHTPTCVKRVAAKQFARSHGGCHSWACVARVKHKAAVRAAREARRAMASYQPSALAVCVARLESTMNRLAVGGGGLYHSYFQWLYSTWARASGGRFGYVPERVGFREQAYVFDHYEPGHRGEWPRTVPRCGG